MQHRTGPETPKDGFFQVFIEPMIGEDNTVRVIAAFVDSLDLKNIGFEHVVLNKTGAPPYHPALLLKLYMYGYFNRIRSSRMIERECGRNIELWWLLDRAVPSYHTIATFRSAKNNRKLFKKVFKLFNQILQGADLFEKKLVAVDGTKIRAQNSKKNNISEEKILKKLEHNSDKFMEYMDELDRADAAEDVGEVPLVSHATINKALDEIMERSTKLEGLLNTLHLAQVADPSLTQLSLTDPEARAKQAGFQKQDFKFDDPKQVYICPEKHELTSTGKVTDKKNRLGLVQNQIMIFKLPFKTCAACPFANKCLTAASYKNRHGRTIERSIYEEVVEANRLRIINNRETYKRRQAIIEHPFGTIKRSWGFYFTLLKGKEKVEAEYSFVFLTYNLRRAINILGAKTLIERIKSANFAKQDDGTLMWVTLLEKPKMVARFCGAGRMDHVTLSMAA